MEKVRVEEIAISTINELTSIIKKTLTECKETQIFISKRLFDRLLQENKSSVIWEEDVVDSFHYSDKTEKAFIFSVKSNNGAKTVQMHLAKDSLDYFRLTFFAIKGVIYRHYSRKMKVILIIN